MCLLPKLHLGAWSTIHGYGVCAWFLHDAGASFMLGDHVPRCFRAPKRLVFSMFYSYQCSLIRFNLHLDFNDSIQVHAYAVLNRFICSLNHINLHSFISPYFQLFESIHVVIFANKIALVTHVCVCVCVCVYSFTHTLKFTESICKYHYKVSNPISTSS